MSMTLVLKVAFLLSFFDLGAVKCLKIDVLQGDNVEKSFTDGNAYFEDRSYMIPRYRSDGIKGNLVYPVPRNACSSVEDAENNSSIAYLTEYMTCPSSSIINLKNAHYLAVVAFTRNISYARQKGFLLPQAVITDKVTAIYLLENVVEDERHSEWEILIWDDTFANLEKLFIIFASTLMGAVILAVVVFCTILFCRLLILRMRTRGLSRLQVRALPKRKYHKMKETAESCSICLEEFKEGETIRVLPCEHVFHPKCVDEWLQRWNRTCPLCKSTVKRKKGLKAKNPPPTTEDETSHLVPHEEAAAPTEREAGRVGGSYGATGFTAPDGECRCHRRNASGASSHTSGSLLGRGSKRHQVQVTAAEIEMSWGSEDTEGRRSPYSPIFHTPLQSDDNGTRSFTTADGESTGVGNIAV